MHTPAPIPPVSGDPQRLSKAVATLRGCSRREAEQLIVEGWVRVDGQCVDLPQARVGAGQRVEIDPQAHLQPIVPVTFLLHKPAGVGAEAVLDLLGETQRWSGDTSGVRTSQTHRRGLKALLPLPTEASGLCVLSQDLRVVRKLTEEAAWVEQELIAEVQGERLSDGLERLCHGLVRDGRPLPPARVSWQSETRLRFAVKGIPPESIAWMCEQVGLKLCALRRIRIGRIAMAGLPPGQWRYLALGERF